MTKYVDAEFERVQQTQQEEEIDEATEPVDPLREQYKSLMDLSLEADPEIMNARIPFFENENYIDVKLAFMAELDGVTYGIGVPFDPSVALVIESNNDGDAAQFLSPDDDENEELMQLMAAQLHEHLGKDLQLKRTPRVLTVDGPLNNYTRNWENQILPRPFTAKELMERDEQDTVEYFLQVMKEELGEEEFQKTMNGEDEDVDDELMALFDIPGLGNDDEEGLEELIKSMLDEDPDEQLKELERFGKVEGEETLKLVGYIIPGGKSYTLVQLLRPYVIVGRYIQDDVENRFELLSPDEALVVEPRLAEVCRKDLEKSGLSLSSGKMN
ncbi:hypothetical protein FisN_6Lh229 [Fistulifera solaris]|uniref:Uncharacterized protein n=1 Tax=Fistulifera solaris TaxID=1519565 RepID=A0A1Z5J6F1_FISSO|nr:hypothetical protein FisN_6Lh229 [Fistulifera solaris]|eukprot:GAX09398.1 hypothetical protein FisN_6Lh229 [Fistulifera solaris]